MVSFTKKNYFFILFVVFEIFSQDVISPVKYEKVNTIVPAYFSLLKSQMEKVKKEVKEEPNSIIVNEFDKKLDDDASMLTSDYYSMYLSKIFDNPILNKINISLRSKKTEIKNLIALISKAIGVDFIIDPDVKGTVEPLGITNVTPGFLLNYILVHHNPQLALIKDMNFWRIMQRAKAENYIKIAERDDVVSEILTVNYANLNDKLKDLLEKTWSNIVADCKNFSFMLIDSDRKKIFLRGLPRSIQDFKTFFCEIDKSVTQVRIDGIILIAQKGFNFAYGINWSGIYNRLNTIRKKGTSFGFVGVGSGLLDYPTPTEPVTEKTGNLFVDPLNFSLNLFQPIVPSGFFTPLTPQTIVKIPFVFGGPDLNLSRLNLLLNASEAEDKVKVISRPSIITGDNEVAKILIGQTIPISATAIDILAVAVQNIASINYKDIGISLEVRPSVSPDKKNIKLEIFVEESEVIAGSTQTNDKGIMTNPPTIQLIKVHNKVDLKNGQTVVIGGLSRCDLRRGSNKVPVLNRLPIIGKLLFTAEAESKQEFEQFIFLTPTIID